LLSFALPGGEGVGKVMEIGKNISAGKGTLQRQEDEAALCARGRQRMNFTWQLQRRVSVRPYRPLEGLTDPLSRVPQALRLWCQVFLKALFQGHHAVL
jgi:hypothetical protein